MRCECPTDLFMSSKATATIDALRNVPAKPLRFAVLLEEKRLLLPRRQNREPLIVLERGRL